MMHTLAGTNETWDRERAELQIAISFVGEGQHQRKGLSLVLILHCMNVLCLCIGMYGIDGGNGHDEFG